MNRIKLVRQYSPILGNDSMHQDHIQGAGGPAYVRPAIFQHPLPKDLIDTDSEPVFTISLGTQATAGRVCVTSSGRSRSPEGAFRF